MRIRNVMFALVVIIALIAEHSQSPINAQQNNSRVTLLMDLKDCPEFEFSPDGKWLAVGCQHELRLYDLNTIDFTVLLQYDSRNLFPFRDIFYDVPQLAFSSDSSLIAVYLPDRENPVLQLRELETAKIRFERRDIDRNEFGRLNVLSFHPENRFLAIAHGTEKYAHYWSGQITILDTINGDTWDSSPQDGGISLLEFSPSGDQIIARYHNGTAHGTILYSFKGNDWYRLGSDNGIDMQTTVFFGDLTISPDWKWLANTSNNAAMPDWGNPQVYLVDFGSETLVNTYNTEDVIQNLQWHPDSQWLALVGNRGSVGLWNVDTDQRTVIYAPDENVLGSPALRFSHNGHYLAAGFEDQHIRLWTMEDDIPLYRDLAGDSVVTQLSFNPTETLLLAASEDQTLSLWDVDTGDLLDTPDGSMGQFSPDGHYLVTLEMVYSGDNSVVEFRLWSMKPSS